MFSITGSMYQKDSNCDYLFLRATLDNCPQNILNVRLPNIILRFLKFDGDLLTLYLCILVNIREFCLKYIMSVPLLTHGAVPLHYTYYCINRGMITMFKEHLPYTSLKLYIFKYY